MFDALGLVAWNQLTAAGMALAVWLCSMTPFLRRRPALRHGLWLLVLFKLVTPSVMSVDMPDFDVASLLVTSNAMADVSIVPPIATAPDQSALAVADPKAFSAGCCAPTTPTTDAAQTTGGTIASVTPSGTTESTFWRTATLACIVVSVAVTALFWMFVLRQLIRMRRLISLHAAESDRMAELLDDVAQRFDLRTAVSLRVVDAPFAPMLWAWPGRAAILLPRNLVRSLDDEALRSIIAHELAHLVRRDHWTNLFSLCVASLFWWNPIVWLVRRRLLSASEACCDALALERLQGSRKTYAATLLAVVDSLKAAPRQRPAIGMTFGGSQSLRRRFELLADDRVRARTSRGGWIVLCATMLGSLFIPAQAEHPAAAADGATTLATFCCPTPTQADATTNRNDASSAAGAQHQRDPKSSPGTGESNRERRSTEEVILWNKPSLERQTRSSRTFSSVGYFAESPTWRRELQLSESQAQALLQLDELVWDTRELNWLDVLAVAQRSKTDGLKDAIAQQSRNAKLQGMVLRHAEQMVKLAFLTPQQSAFVTHRQLSNAAFRQGALLYDPFLQKQIGLNLSPGEADDLRSRGLAAVPDVLSDESEARLAELMAEKPQPTGPPDLPAPSDEELAAIALPAFFQGLKERQQAVRLSEQQLKALDDLERLTRLGLFWIDHRAGDEAATTRKEFLDHAEQIVRLGILTPAQAIGFFGISC